MLTDRIKAWITPPVFQGDEMMTRQAGFLTIGLVISFIFTSIIFAGNILGGKTQTEIMVLNMAYLTVIILSWILMRRRMIRLSCHLILILGFIFITVVTAYLGTVRSPITSVYILIVLFAGLVLGLRGIVFWTVISSLTVAGLIAAENSHLLPNPDYSVAETQWVTYTALFTFCGMLIYWAMRLMRQDIRNVNTELAGRLETREDLINSEARYRSLFENAVSGISLTNLEGTVLALNPASCSIFDATPEEILGRRTINKWEDEADRKKFLWDIMENGHVHNREARIITGKGTVKTILYSAVLDRKNGVIIGTQIDISDRKKAEEALQESEERFRLIFDQSPIGAAMVSLDFRYLRVNDMLCRITGYSKEELTGMRFTDISHPGDQNRETGLAERLAAGGNESRSMDKRYIKKNGEIIWIHLVVRMMKSPSGRPLYYLPTMEDITKRKTGEFEFQELSNQNKILLDAFPCVALLLKPSTREIVASNKAAHEVGAVPGECCYATWGGRKVPCPWCLAPELWETGAAQSLIVESEGMTWDAHWIPVSDDLYMHYAFDITEKVKAEKQLKANMEEKDILLAEIHHRVKNNMQIITSLLNLQKNKLKDENAREQLAMAENRIRSMALVHEQLYRKSDMASINFEEYLKKLIQQIFMTFGNPKEGVTYDIMAGGIFLSIDKAIPCGLIITELVTNSLKHAYTEKTQGKISIDFKRDEKYHTLIVRDDGAGMPSGVDPAAINSLGMQIVDALVTQIRGEMKILRENGTVTIINFPL